MPPDTHQGFAFTVTWNLLSALSLLFFRGNPTLRQLGGKVSCCFCLDRKISCFLFEFNFPKQRWEYWGFLLMNWHLLWMASSPWGAHFLVCGRKSTCSWWKDGKIPLGQLQSAWVCQRFTLGHLKNVSLAVDDLAGQLFLRKPGAAPCQELRVALLACPFHLGPRLFPLMLTHSRLPECPQQPSLTVLQCLFTTLALPPLPNTPCSKCQDGCLTIPALPLPQPCHTALVLCHLLQPRSFVAALILTDTMPN